MEPLVDVLLLTMFLSGVFCVLGVVAGLCEWAEQRFLRVGSIRWRSSSQCVKKLPVKNAGTKTANTAFKTRDSDGVVVRGFGVHRKAA